MDDYKIIITKRAAEDLKEILTYISKVLKEPKSALRIYKEIKLQILSLEQMPERHSLVNDEDFRNIGIRKIPIENYIVFYIVDRLKSQVQILRILYNRREWQSFL